jgi:putative (di)nucleoside polyphosphate hydrolase
MVDKNGFRLNVGIVLSNPQKQLFWGRRSGKKDAWQFPQGGIQRSETPEQAMYRELYEETGLSQTDVQLLGQTQHWFCYYLPKYLRRPHEKPLCIGQKQKWFLLQLLADEQRICFDHTDTPEFTDWRWVDYWYPLEQVIQFKKEVYKNALKELEPFLA